VHKQLNSGVNMTPGATDRLDTAVSDFRRWANSHSSSVKSAEWEAEYEHWQNVADAFKAFLDLSEPNDWSQDDTESILYILARDNECETLKDELIVHPGHLLALARAGIHSTEVEARWQLADALGSVKADDGTVSMLLDSYCTDPSEYVSRRALLAAGRRLMPGAEAAALRAWETGHEYQRMAALTVLFNVYSTNLPSYLEFAQQDGRQHLMKVGDQIRSDQRGSSS
jgi:hypothetical protein